MVPLFKRIVSLIVFAMTAFYCNAQNGFFTDASEASVRNAAQKRVIVPGKYRTLKLASEGMLSFLKLLPSEQKITNRNFTPVLDIPMPNGTMARFHVWESAAMEPALAAANPSIKTYTGQGIDDPTATIKIDWTEFGFHAMILSSVTGSVFIDPYDQKTVTNYVSYYKADFTKKGTYRELAPIKNPQLASRGAAELATGVCVGSQLRTYRLAVACTHEYAIAATGQPNPTVAQALAKIVTTANRVNGVYEKELSVRMVLVAAENSIIFVDSIADPFTGNDDPGTLINESQTVIDANILSANYDIGHTFSTGGGGLAYLGVVCTSGQKGRGITGSTNPVGDAYDIDYVAHEIGHQFGGNHTFNSIAGACDGNGASNANAEPGSGSTIMAYAGICGSDNLQNNSNAQFHAVSFNEITALSVNGSINSCAAIIATGNTPPVVTAGADYVIPKSTPFVLSGGGTDANGDALTFSWEQMNVGGSFGAWNTPADNAPIFRSFAPKSTPVRYFPQLSDVINNTTTKGEILPSYARTLNFRLTARDNRAGGGGVCFDEANITVSGTAGPFVVTYPDAAGITWYVNDFKTITWNPSGTAAAPINCSNVKIELSTDGGNSFPVVLIASTPNDGSAEIQVPANITATARIRISAVGNVFYDLSNTNFSIQNSPTADYTFNSPEPVSICGNTGSASAIIKTAALSGFTTAINLSTSGNPAGTTVTLGNSPLTPGSNTTLTLNNTNTLAAGTYDITVTGIAGAVNKSRIVSFVINPAPTAPATLTSPIASATGVSLLPLFNWAPVTGATSYTLDISTSNTFTPIVQTVTNITSLPKALTTPLAENTIYYWRVTTTNSCGTGSASVTGIFKTGINPCRNSTDIPKAISATGTPTITSTLVIPAANGAVINDLNVVGLTGSHLYVADITVTLTSPAGTNVVLFDQICSGFADFNFNLDDEAALAIGCPITGNKIFKPQNVLSAFDGQNSAGTWTLTIKDNYDADGGNLTGWGLAVNNCAPIATSISTTPWASLCPATASTALTSNLTGTVYQWQLNTGSGFTNITNNANYAGATAATLQITNAPSSWTGYQYRCVTDGANSTVFTLGFVNVWNGSISNAWETAGNWSCNTIPDIYTDVIINSGAVVVNSNGICRSIRVNPASSVTVNTGFKLTVAH